MSAEVADLLDRAAQRIRANGWCQGHYGPADGPNCAAGAVMFEATLRPLEYRATTALRRAMGIPITAWNDEPGRTVEQVLDAFARAAAAERAK